MSLINDALKRAKETQQNNPPPPPPPLQFRPAENTPERSALPVVIGIVVLVASIGLVGVFAFWLASGRPAPRSAEPQTAVPASQSAAPDRPDAMPPPERLPEPAPVVAAPSATQETKPVAATAQASSLVVTNPLPPATNAVVAVAEAVPPKPAAPKLQGIAYRPGRASAVIDGKTVGVGDRVGEYRVSDIGPEKVTLAGADQIVVLSLER